MEPVNMTTAKMTPKRPKAEAKISTTSNLTNKVGLAASDKAAPAPVIPTEILRRETTCNKKEEGKKVSQKKEWPIVR